MKELLDRLLALQIEAEALIDKINEEVDAGEIISGPLYNVKGSIEEVSGGLILQQHKKGKITFTETNAG
jgi:hypothetical protein